jgi:membrane fusion protein (multidrug efflux system)
MVAEVYATTGSIASPQSPAIKLISSNMEIVIQVPEAQVANVFEDQPAALKVSPYPSEDFPALVDTVAPSADSTSHTFPVTIIPADGAGKLRAGMFAEITLLLEEKTNVVLIPRTAMTLIGEQEVVYVVSEDGQTVTQRPVTTGLSTVDQIEIVEGLSAGETIVTAGLSNLSDGARIEIVARTE